MDELHLINKSVGNTMEVVTSRMRYISSQLKPIRVVGLCTSLADAGISGMDWCVVPRMFSFPPGGPCRWTSHPGR